MGIFGTYVHFRVTYREIALITNARVLPDNIQITDVFPLLDSVVRFRGLGSTLEQGISNILENALHRGASKVNF